MNKILITGVAGFIGSHLAKSLIEKGHDVIGIDIKDIAHNDMMGSLVVSSSFTYVKKDVRKVGVFDIIRWSPTHIVHLAAVPGVRASKGEEVPYFKSNIEGFFSMINSTYWSRLNVKFIYASSSSVYNHSNDDILPMHPFSEINSSIDMPSSFYALSKKTNEEMASFYAQKYGMKTIGLRFFSVYGENGRHDMFPYIAAKKIMNKERIDIDDSLDTKRDFTYVGDIVEAIERIMFTTPPSEPSNALYNIGSGEPHSLGDMIREMEDYYGIGAIVNEKHMKEDFNPEYTYADMSLFKKRYGNIIMTPFKAGIHKMLKKLE